MWDDTGKTLKHFSIFISWRFQEPHPWTVIFNSFHRISIGLKPGDWLGHSSSFISFSKNQLMCIWDHYLSEMSNLFSSSSASKMATDLYQECLDIFPFILLSVTWALLILYAEKWPHTIIFPPPNVTVGMVFLVPFVLSLGLTWLIFNLPVCHRFVQMFCSKL